MRGSDNLGYAMAMSDGTSWWLTGDKYVRRWLVRHAAVMNLEQRAACDSPKIVFTMLKDTNYISHKMSDSVIEQWCERAADDKRTCYDYRDMRIWYHENVADVICEIKNDDAGIIEYRSMWRSLQPVYQRSICRGGAPFHAALAELDGCGVVLAAPSHVGKSTCCMRLPDYWKPLCDDVTLVVLNKGKEYRAHPFPTWSDYVRGHSGKTWNVQYSVPLSGIFFLEHAEEDEAVPVGQGEASILINSAVGEICQRFWEKLDRESQRKSRSKVYHNACEMAKQIPAFRLRVSLYGKFWEEIEKALERIWAVRRYETPEEMEWIGATPC